MDKIVAVTFDIADQCCKTYNAMEWHNFIADTRMKVPESIDEGRAEWNLYELFDEVYGDEFWFEVIPNPFAVYAIAFDLRSEEFVHCKSDAECEMYWEMAQASGCEDEVFWAE